MTDFDRPKQAVGRSSLVPEAGFQAAVCEAFRLRGWRVYHNPDSRRSDAGWPDLQLLKAPYLVFAELKVPGGKVKPVQDMVINELRSAGQEVYVWYPEDWDEIEKVVNR